jgi:hypothetical protein
MEDEENTMENSFEQAFGWFAIINRLCEDDITRHTQVLKTTIIEALNQLLYILEKEKYVIRLQKQAQSKINS